MFGEREILRTMFTFADKDHDGYISTEDFLDLLDVLFPYPAEKKAIKPQVCPPM